jgi:RHS repeat-associated protein
VCPAHPFRFSGRNPGKPSHQLHVSLCRLTAGQDYLGRRISRTIYGAPSVTTKYAYDGNRIIAEYDGSGTLLRKFVYGPGIDEPICLIEVAENNAVYYYHFDGLGSVVALSDVNSVLVERYTYDVFGRPAIRDANGTEIAASAFANPYLFTGRAYDAETGLYYYRARYYDYATGRFLQPDPTGYASGLNLYTYCSNNPAVFVDPDGQLHLLVTGLIVGLAGGLVNGALEWNAGRSFSTGFAVGFVGGAVTGTRAGLGVPLPWAGAIGGFTSSAVGQYASGASASDIFLTPEGVGRLVLGGATGFAGGVATNKLAGNPIWAPIAKELLPAILESLGVGIPAGGTDWLGNKLIDWLNGTIDMFRDYRDRWNNARRCAENDSSEP